MTIEEKRIKLEEADGYKPDGPWENYWTHKNGPAGVSIPTEALPDYFRDHEAINALVRRKFTTKEQLVDWGFKLCLELNKEPSPIQGLLHELALASAAQKAEAAGQALGLWA